MRQAVLQRESDRLSRTFAALADPTRRAILARLSTGQTAVSVLAEPHAMSLPAISKHLRVLERSGLIERGRDAQWRPCRLRAEPLRAATDWMEQYRRHWEESFDRLDDYLQTLQAGAKKAAGRPGAPASAHRQQPKKRNPSHGKTSIAD